jgi:hypothetical protein
VPETQGLRNYQQTQRKTVRCPSAGFNQPKICFMSRRACANRHTASEKSISLSLSRHFRLHALPPARLTCSSPPSHPLYRAPFLAVALHTNGDRTFHIWYMVPVACVACKSPAPVRVGCAAAGKLSMRPLPPPCVHVRVQIAL